MRIVAGARLADGSTLRDKVAIEPLGDVKECKLEASESSPESYYGAAAQIASLPVRCTLTCVVLLLFFFLFFFF